MKNVVIYGRSNPNENIDIQVDELVEYAKNNNMKITKMYLDEEYLPFDYCRPYLKMLQHDADLKLLDKPVTSMSTNIYSLKDNYIITVNDNMRYSIMNILAYVLDRVVNDYMAQCCRNNHSVFKDPNDSSKEVIIYIEDSLYNLFNSSLVL